MEPYKPNEHLADAVNNAIADAQIRGGIELEALVVGRKLYIYMRPGYYLLERLEDGLYMTEVHFDGSYSKFASVPTKCVVAGSLFHPDGSMLKMRYIGRGMFLEWNTIPAEHPRLISKEILEIIES